MSSQQDPRFEELVKVIDKYCECPVCFKFIKPPLIHQCLNGHFLCSECVRKVKNRCPVCRAIMPTIPIRNLAFESVFKCIYFICPNKGCLVKSRQQAEMDEHKGICTAPPPDPIARPDPQRNSAATAIFNAIPFPTPSELASGSHPLSAQFGQSLQYARDYPHSGFQVQSAEELAADAASMAQMLEQLRVIDQSPESEFGQPGAQPAAAASNVEGSMPSVSTGSMRSAAGAASSSHSPMATATLIAAGNHRIPRTSTSTWGNNGRWNIPATASSSRRASTMGQGARTSAANPTTAAATLNTATGSPNVSTMEPYADFAMAAGQWTTAGSSGISTAASGSDPMISTAETVEPTTGPPVLRNSAQQQRPGSPFPFLESMPVSGIVDVIGSSNGEPDYPELWMQEHIDAFYQNPRNYEYQGFLFGTTNGWNFKN